MGISSNGSEMSLRKGMRELLLGAPRAPRGDFGSRNMRRMVARSTAVSAATAGPRSGAWKAWP
jgi:hypothetical protein